MAKQKGIIKLTGTIDDLNFYFLNGKAVVRKAGGGFNSKAIKTKKSMRRVRENSSEFGAASKMKKHYCLGWQPMLGGIKHPKLHGRMMRLFTQLKDLDTVHPRGQRQVAQGVQTAKGERLLRNFEFTPSCEVWQLLGVTPVLDTAKGMLTLPNLDVSNMSFPEGATHIGLRLGCLHFNFETLEKELQLSDWSVLEATFPKDDVSIQVVIPRLEGMPFFVVQIQFYERIGEEFYALHGADAVGLGLVLDE